MTSIATTMSKISPVGVKSSRFALMKLFTFENASSIGLRSGEYGGRYSSRTPSQWIASATNSTNNTHQIDRLMPVFPRHDEFLHCPLPERWNRLEKVRSWASRVGRSDNEETQSGKRMDYALHVLPKTVETCPASWSLQLPSQIPSHECSCIPWRWLACLERIFPVSFRAFLSSPDPIVAWKSVHLLMFRR